jgi:hypothetical protein
MERAIEIRGNIAENSISIVLSMRKSIFERR